MSKLRVSIVDYGLGNILSVVRAFEFCGADVTIVKTADDVSKSSKVVLPGVGAMKIAMDSLNGLGISSSLLDIANRNIPFLGICLGAQMLCDESEEHGITKGLGIIRGRVVAIPNLTAKGLVNHVPNSGWSTLIPCNGYKNFDGSLLQNCTLDKYFYFSHSYEMKLDDQKQIIAKFEYGGRLLAGFIQKNNIYGCQFHPEKSGEVGLNIIKAFLEV
jgi:glutamine amidotransferase